MDLGNAWVLIPILVPLAFFAMTFGVVYLYKRERMAMIERGMDPRRYKPQTLPFQTLKWALLLVGAGTGLFLAFLLDNTLFSKFGEKFDDGSPAIYFSLIAIFGGLGLLLSYRIEKKDGDNQKAE
jgi:hypothetical protein